MGKEHFYAELSGTPYEIGYGHGSLAKEYVYKSIETYKDQFKNSAGVDWEDAKKAAPKYIPYIKDYDPDLLEEMQGVADGAGLDLEDIIALNARSEVLMTMKKKTAEQLLDGCTNIAVGPERTTNGHTLLAHNWDWKASQKEAIVVFKIHQQNKPDMLMITEAGIIGKFGVNEYGIAVAMNALASPSDANGVPLHCILRGILNSKNVFAAIKAIGGKLNACPANYMMASGAVGEVFDCERMTDDYEIIFPDDYVLVHTNHPTSTKIKIKYVDNTIGLTTSTYIRYHRAGKLIRQYDKIGVDELKKVLSDHADDPNCICAHPDPNLDLKRAGCTVFNMIIDCTEKSMEICKGNPCCGEYYKLYL